jgi:hypothetical protein
MSTAGTRYDLMEDTTNLAEGSDTYPDCLSFFIKLEDFIQSEPPLQYGVTSLLIQRPYFITAQYFGLPTYDDLLLTLNQIPYISTMTEGDPFYIPAKSDVYSFYTSKSTIGASNI